jgi:hypothetical protein
MTDLLRGSVCQAGARPVHQDRPDGSGDQREDKMGPQGGHGE